MDFKEYLETLKEAASNPIEARQAIDRAEIFIELFGELTEKLEPEDEEAAELYEELIEKYLKAWLEL